jgi:hypothetical protein
MTGDREWADDELTRMSARQLAEYLAATPSTTWDIAASCSDINLSKIFEVALEAAKLENVDSAVDVIGALIRGLSYRFKQEGGIPDEVLEQLIAVLSRMMARCPSASGHQVDSEL